MNAMWPRRAAVREMTIQQALEWAFAVEHARIDFDETGAHEFDRPGVDTIWILQRHRELGCRVDGGGTSDPHPDAQIIAAAVEALPIGVGGRRMALLVAECARARRVPDWREDERRGVLPCGWDMTDDGEWLAGTRKLDVVTFRDAKSRTKTYRPEICPISYTGTAAVLAKRRREYLAWYGALLHLLYKLSWCNGFTAIRLVDGLPDPSPWNAY
ncbi:hypothetical protein LO749_01590 [Paracoccus denitrificans]|uniref:hypothetical protein n=1 Tax=Paracoccus denitrificans TaxID=266 RepID=UPI001E4F71C2|nr:hypothetical protein [Paracoccus denitrificans]UFS65288.1 hypothetical protein LO749_01590 [Paracoccus denitrificans]